MFLLARVGDTTFHYKSLERFANSTDSGTKLKQIQLHNMNILERKKIRFYNKVDQFGRNYKGVYPIEIDELTGYVVGFVNVQDLDDLLTEIDRGLSGNLPSTGIDYSTDDLFATLKNTGISFSYEADSPQLITATLSDLKKLCEAWRAFLLTLPLNGTKVK